MKPTQVDRGGEDTDHISPCISPTTSQVDKDDLSFKRTHSIKVFEGGDDSFGNNGSEIVARAQTTPSPPSLPTLNHPSTENSSNASQKAATSRKRTHKRADKQARKQPKSIKNTVRCQYRKSRRPRPPLLSCGGFVSQLS